MGTTQTSEVTFKSQFASPEFGEQIQTAAAALVATVLERAQLPEGVHWQSMKLARGSVEEMGIRGDGAGGVTRMDHILKGHGSQTEITAAFDRSEEGQVSLIKSVKQTGAILGNIVAVGNGLADETLRSIGACTGLAAEIVVAVPATE